MVLCTEYLQQRITLQAKARKPRFSQMGMMRCVTDGIFDEYNYVTKTTRPAIHLGPSADVVLSCCFPKIDQIKAGELQDFDWHGGGRQKGRILALLSRIP